MTIAALGCSVAVLGSIAALMLWSAFYVRAHAVQETLTEGEKVTS